MIARNTGGPHGEKKRASPQRILHRFHHYLTFTSKTDNETILMCPEKPPSHKMHVARGEKEGRCVDACTASIMTPLPKVN